MFSARLIKYAALMIISLGLAGCDGMTDDLNPSSDDNRPAVEAGTSGAQVGQISPDFSLFDTLGGSRGLYAELDLPKDGVVLYFTMWCPICDAHASHMRNHVIPDFPDVTFFLVDYVSGSISASRRAQEDSGFTDIETLVDADQVVFDLYDATMATTVVIDSNKVVRMNEDYKDGVKLIETLQALP